MWLSLSFSQRFKRHDTPHPKELRDRHAKYIKSKKSGIDGHIIPHQEKKEVSTELENDMLNISKVKSTELTAILYHIRKRKK